MIWVARILGNHQTEVLCHMFGHILWGDSLKHKPSICSVPPIKWILKWPLKFGLVRFKFAKQGEPTKKVFQKQKTGLGLGGYIT